MVLRVYCMAVYAEFVLEEGEQLKWSDNRPMSVFLLQHRDMIIMFL
jgi:hypothetical protein